VVVHVHLVTHHHAVLLLLLRWHEVATAIVISHVLKDPCVPLVAMPHGNLSVISKKLCISLS
jgi:hypothetical protein